jgi:type IV pilus assembly protein PilA|tara:strand:+ start:1313 stop:1981 length:669 start_codon:yes stop_codon:yes gene_type:complete
MKKLQKGFSLVELLVVVAIIGVLAGVGIVGYTGYTQSAKERVSIANFNSVKRFVSTELTLLNNNVQTTSASVRQFQGAADTCVATAAVTQIAEAYNNNTDTLEDFLKGVVCYFDATVGYGSQFGNPFDPAVSQVIYNGGTGAGNIGVAPEEGIINISLLGAAAAARSGVGEITQAMVDDSVGNTAGGQFIIEYNLLGVVAGVETLLTGTQGDVVGKLYELED